MIDCHVHTARCGHGEGTAAEYLIAARRTGVDVLTFTEHLPLPEELDPSHEYAMLAKELPAYVHEVGSLAAASREAGDRMRVLTGIEADWLPAHTEHVQRLLTAHEFDVALGSVHFLDGWAFDDPGLIDRWGSRDVDATWKRYFELLADAAASGLFDVIAHPDLVKKFGHLPSFDPGELFEATAQVFARAGVAVEVSSAGLRKPVGEMYPSAAFLAACAGAGVPATFGSDAHRPVEVGFGWDAAREMLQAAGYDRLVYYERRVPKEYPL